MSRYRIAERINTFGTTEYMPQRRFMKLFWVNMSGAWLFTSLAAELFIKEAQRNSGTSYRYLDE